MLLVTYVLCLTNTSNSLSLTLVVTVGFVFSWTSFYCCSNAGGLSEFLLFLLWLLSLVFFLTSSLLVLFVTFELSVLPLVSLILFFGYQPEKLCSTLYLLLYTVIGGVPLFFFVSQHMWASLSCLSAGSSFLYFLVSLAFFIKSPLYFFHSWLPKAHTEAPLLGSIILAGVILKFGGYGILLLAPSFGSLRFLFFYISLLGSVVCSVHCLRHWDIKTLVAYSSVVHIGVVSLGALSSSEVGWWVSVGIIVCHSFISPLLFCLCYDLYTVTYSRALISNRLASLGSGMCLVAALLLCINIGTPPFVSFWVEVSLYIALHTQFSLGTWILFIVSFLVFWFCISFYLKVFSGSVSLVRSSTFQYTNYLPGLAFSLLSAFCSPIFRF